MEGVKQTVEVSADGLILWCEMQEAERHGRPQDAIAREPILVYSKSYCPHSQRAKRILQGLPDELGPGADMPPTTVVELDQLGQLGANMQAYLAQLTGQRTVPNVSCLLSSGQVPDDQTLSYIVDGVHVGDSRFLSIRNT